MTAVYPTVRRREWLRPAMVTCPECDGRGYTATEIREHATVWDPEYTVSIPVTCYKTRRCWMCQGTGKVRGDR